MNLAILAFSLVVVTLGAEGLVRGASAVALRAGLSPLFVGLTIVGFGTSAPELAASVVASLRGSSGVAVGNVIGSNIFNVGAILGITALLAPIRVQLAAVRRDLWAGVVASVLPLVSLILGGVLPTWSGYVLIALLCSHLGWAYRTGRAASEGDEQRATVEVESTLDLEPRRGRLRDRLSLNVAFLVLGLCLLALGSRWFVTAAIQLARGFGVSDLIIGLTVVSAGTSLPELVTSIVAARRGNPDIAIGNVLGSNLFNLLGILGVSAVIHPQAVGRDVAFIDIPVMLLGMLALLPIVKTGSVISRREGAFLFSGFVFYLVGIVLRAT